MSTFYLLLGVIWTVAGIMSHGTDGLIEIAISTVFLVGSQILSQLKKK